jgi:hypothetical protein
MKKNLTLLFLILLVRLSAQQFKVDTILYHGVLANRINLVVLVDGYTVSDMSHFKTDVQGILNAFWNAEPWKEYKNYVNVFAIEVVSSASGAIHPNTAPDCPTSPAQPILNPSTYFGSTFDYGGIHRLLVPGNASAVANVMAANFPNYDQILMLVNSPYYGGSGGQYATVSLHPSSPEIALHETSHSFSGVADEYYAGAQYMTEKPNLTQQNNPALNKWTKWVGFTGPAGLIDIYPHSGDPTWFKPTTGGKCRMEALGRPFCNVCMEAHIERIHSLVKPYDSYLPAGSTVGASATPIVFSIKEVKPIPNTLKTNWTLDGTAYVSLKDSITLTTNTLSTGAHTLSMTIIDTTALVRIPSHFSTHIYTVQWTINKTATGITLNSDEKEISLSVFPNPNSDILNVSFVLTKAEQIQFELMDVQGKGVFSSNLGETGAGTHALEIPVKTMGLPAGLYFLKMQFGKEEVTRRVIIE